MSKYFIAFAVVQYNVNVKSTYCFLFLGLTELADRFPADFSSLMSTFHHQVRVGEKNGLIKSCYEFKLTNHRL